MRRPLTLSLVVIFVSALSCAPFVNGEDAGVDGGGDANGFVPPAACSDAPGCVAPLADNDACGGDPTGSWMLCAACSAPSLVSLPAWEECQEASVTVLDVRPASGSLELSGEGSYSLSLESEVVVAILLPPACTVGEQCEVGRPDPFLEASACERYDDGTCDCTGVLSGSRAHEGSWQVVEGALVLTRDNVSESLPFCVDGNALSLAFLSSGDVTGGGLVLVRD